MLVNLVLFCIFYLFQPCRIITRYKVIRFQAEALIKQSRRHVLRYQEFNQF